MIQCRFHMYMRSSNPISSKIILACSVEAGYRIPRVVRQHCCLVIESTSYIRRRCQCCEPTKSVKMAYPPPHIVDPQPGHLHTHTVILLHGRSSTAQEFANDLFSLRTSSPPENLPSIFPGFRWVFPDAGERWCTSFREKRSAWCDTYSLENLSLRQDLQVIGLRDGALLIKNIIEEEAARLGGNSETIILGGFSQGSATSLWSLFTGAAATKGRLGGFVGLSAWMPFTREARLASDVGNATQSQTLHARIEHLTDTFLDVLGLDALVPTSTVQHCLRELPVFLGHGTDVCRSFL